MLFSKKNTSIPKVWTHICSGIILCIRRASNKLSGKFELSRMFALTLIKTVFHIGRSSRFVWQGLPSRAWALPRKRWVLHWCVYLRGNTRNPGDDLWDFYTYKAGGLLETRYVCLYHRSKQTHFFDRNLSTSL